MFDANAGIRIDSSYDFQCSEQLMAIARERKREKGRNIYAKNVAVSENSGTNQIYKFRRFFFKKHFDSVFILSKHFESRHLLNVNIIIV